MVNLDAHQRALLDAVRAAHVHRLTVRADAEVEARQLVADRIAAALRAESVAVRAALDAKIPRSRIGVEGLSSKDWRTVERVLAVTEPDLAAAAGIEQARAALRTTQVRRATPDEVTALRERLHPNGDRLVRIDWRGYQAEPGGNLELTFHRTDFHLDGWAHRVYPGDNDDYMPIDTTDRELDVALRYESQLRRTVSDVGAS